MDANNPFLADDAASSPPMQPQYERRYNEQPYGYPPQDDYSDIADISLQAVLDEINHDWSFMLEEDFDPVTLALALMDDSSVGKGKDYRSFQRVLHDLDLALKSIVDEYQWLDSQQRVAQMKANLRKCKGELLEKRTDLLSMWFKSEQHKEMLGLLEAIEDIRATPDKLEALMNSKHVLSAAQLVTKSFKMVNSKDMKQIGALDDLRRTLTAQKNALYDLLIEELHNHLYLKSPYCDTRWAAYVPEQQTLPESAIKPRSFGMSSSSNADQAEDMFAVDENDILREDVDKDPETDSYYYIEIIMEALAVLGDIPSALETMCERLPLEVHRLVDKTIGQVEERQSSLAVQKLPSPATTAVDPTDIYCLDKANSESKNEVLKDLLWTLFSKMEAVLRGFRFTETCARRIKKRMNNMLESEGLPLQDFKVYHFHEIWRPVQAEIRSLLQDYLTSEDHTPANLQVDDGIGKSMFGSREKSRQLFKFTDTPEDNNLQEAYNEVQRKLFTSFKKQLPGFDMTENSKLDPLLHSSIVDKYASDMASKSHRLLVKPDAYNVSVLLKPTMAFLERLREVFPNYDDQNEEGFGSFLDDFAINVFLPQIEEKVMQLISHATVGLDAFHDDRNYKNFSKYPIVKSALALISVIQSLCRTMHTMPFHIEEYVRMIEVVLLKYYEKCYQRFYSTVAKGGAYDDKEKNTAEIDICTSGDWAQDESLVALLAQNPYFNDDTEIGMELKLKEDKQIETEELIFEPKRLVALGRLYHSLKWFVREIWELRTPSQQNKLPTATSVASHLNLASENDPATSVEVSDTVLRCEDFRLKDMQAMSNRRWSLDGVPRRSSVGDMGPVLLPLRGEAAKRYDTLLTTYQQLAETCLFTLRLENRCHVMYYLEMAVREGNYYLEDETYEPDPYVITLNQDLMDIDDCINASLPPKDELFAFDGLPALIVHLLISEASYIKRMNANGVQKMMRNILALQQNLSNFVPPSQSSVMERAREYYQLFNLGSEAMIRGISENGPRFTFDEYRTILGLIHDVKAEGEGHEGPSLPETDENRSGGTYSSWLLRLDDVMAKYET
ncbi:hypothetical protein BCR43DRAFT_508347 [Syncephalastrum racemosum]|uniref:Exocyst complex component Sec8 n=1 Tax=Syncephalastrum racemosum TaxID=13706 RepID=A0A1X2H3C3_SYNRA|nr:hypothetical protein BCR43DRAFT_508347 [Syncephalastrum racemosum]